jgi:hypothetical protein
MMAVVPHVHLLFILIHYDINHFRDTTYFKSIGYCSTC